MYDIRTSGYSEEPAALRSRLAGGVVHHFGKRSRSPLRPIMRWIRSSPNVHTATSYWASLWICTLMTLPRSMAKNVTSIPFCEASPISIPVKMTARLVNAARKWSVSNASTMRYFYAARLFPCEKHINPRLGATGCMSPSVLNRRLSHWRACSQWHPLCHTRSVSHPIFGWSDESSDRNYSSLTSNSASMTSSSLSVSAFPPEALSDPPAPAVVPAICS